MSVEQLKAQRREKRRQLNSYIKRRNSINLIISNIDIKFDDDVTDINKQVSNCINEVTSGIRGCGITETISTNMEGCKQRYSPSDSKISSARSNFSSEVRRCQEEINSLHWEISNLEDRINSQGGTIHFWE